MKVSVVIRTKNEERWVGHSIQSIIDLLDSPEIIVVDNNSIDSTIHIVRSFQHSPELAESDSYSEIKILNIEDYSPGKALNFGIENASNDYILIISSHCVLNKINIQKHISDLKKHASIFGNQIPIWKGKKIGKRYLWSHFVDKEVKNMYSDMENRYFLHNAISLFKKQTLIDFPFDEYLVGKEDRYWANKIIDKGFTTLYDPEMEANHHYTDNGNTWKGIG